ncbi:hypothetical protein V2J09_001702 [Rumex salicifolius]
MESNKFLFILVCFVSHLCSFFSERTSSFSSVPDLEKSMYVVVDGNPCVRLLSLSGEIGCANPGRGKVVAPIVKYKSADVISEISTVLVSSDEAQDFFLRLVASLHYVDEIVSKDPEFSRNIGGVLVEANAMNLEKLKGSSPAEKFPQAKFAPYQNGSHEWNPNGSGIMWKSYNFPVFLLSKNSTSTLNEVAHRTEKQKNAYSTDVAEFHLVMQTTKSGTRDSESCLKQNTCLPLGGYSVWSALPPISVSSNEEPKPIILTIASMDTASFFRDRSFGADSSTSGLVALLAAVDALSHALEFKNIKKQLVFLVLTGESWGYLGSRRFLHELDLNTESVKGLDKTLIETVLEIGSIGKGYHDGSQAFYAHATRDSVVINNTLNALHSAQATLKSEGVRISRASASNPGIPPSSLMSFLNKNSQISGVVLEDFDTAYANNYYHTNINSTSIVAAASLLARSLYLLANDVKNMSTSDLSAVKINSTFVEELLDCLLNCNPGLSCGLIKNHIAATITCPSNYVGVVLSEPSSTAYPGYSSDIARFIWNFLADKTSVKMVNAASNCVKGCNSTGEVCIKAEIDGKGVCVKSTTRYVPAYSTRLKYDSGSWNLLPANTSDPMEVADPVWTESNWDAIGVKIYTKQGTVYDRLTLLGGLAITSFAYATIIATKSFIAKTLKRD